MLFHDVNFFVQGNGVDTKYTEMRKWLNYAIVFVNKINGNIIERAVPIEESKGPVCIERSERHVEIFP